MVYDGVIEGKTVRLRSVEERDAESTYKMRSDPERARFIHKASGTIDDQREFIREQRLKPNDFLFIIEDLEGKPIGMKGILDYDEKTNSVESGRFIGFGSQVQNIEALKLSFDFAFDILKVNQIRMAALECNKTMIGIQKKFGAVISHKEPCIGFDYENVYSVLSRESYAVSKPKVEQLIDRFANRDLIR